MYGAYELNMPLKSSPKYFLTIMYTLLKVEIYYFILNTITPKINFRRAAIEASEVFLASAQSVQSANGIAPPLCMKYKTSEKISNR